MEGVFYIPTQQIRKHHDMKITEHCFCQDCYRENFSIMFHCLVHDDFMPLLANDPVRIFEVKSCLLPFNCVLKSISILQNRNYEKRVHQEIRTFFVLRWEDSHRKARAELPGVTLLSILPLPFQEFMAFILQPNEKIEWTLPIGQDFKEEFQAPPLAIRGTP